MLSRKLINKTLGLKATTMSRPLLSQSAAFSSDSSKKLTADSAQSTPLTTILDRTAEVLFITEIFRGLALTAEVGKIS